LFSILRFFRNFKLFSIFRDIRSDTQFYNSSSSYYNMGCSSCVQDDNCGFCYQNHTGSCDLINDTDTSFLCHNHEISDTTFWSESFCPKNQASWLSLMGMMLYLVTFAPGMGPVPWAVNAEIYPQSCRESGMAISTSVNWICNCVVSLTFLRLVRVSQVLAS